MIRRIYEKFIDQQMDECIQKCKDDLRGMTRFVTWDVDGKGGSSALYRSLPTPKKMVEIYSVAVEGPKKNVNQIKQGKNNGKPEDKVMEQWAKANGAMDVVDVSSNQITESRKYEEEAQVADYYDLLQLTEEMLAGRNANRTSTVVTALVQYIIRSWRDHFARTVTMKFNCFYLMPFMDDFPAFLRNELDAMYESGMGELFDITEARMALQTKRSELQAECEANSKLQRRFDTINAQLRASQPAPSNDQARDEQDALDYGSTPEYDFESGEQTGDRMTPLDANGMNSEASSNNNSNNGKGGKSSRDWGNDMEDV
jgi:hypothetical protein